MYDSAAACPASVLPSMPAINLALLNAGKRLGECSETDLCHAIQFHPFPHHAQSASSADSRSDTVHAVESHSVALPSTQSKHQERRPQERSPGWTASASKHRRGKTKGLDYRVYSNTTLSQITPTYPNAHWRWAGVTLSSAVLACLPACLSVSRAHRVKY